MPKVLLVIGDATEVLDTMYPYFRLPKDGFEVVVAAPEKRLYHMVLHERPPRWDITQETAGYHLPSDIAFHDVNAAAGYGIDGQKTVAAEASEGKFSSEGLVAMAGDDGPELSLARVWPRTWTGRLIVGGRRRWGKPEGVAVAADRQCRIGRRGPQGSGRFPSLVGEGESSQRIRARYSRMAEAARGLNEVID